MRAFQLASNIDPERIDRIEAQLQAQRLASADGITECQFQLAALKKHISEDLLPK